MDIIQNQLLSYIQFSEHMIISSLIGSVIGLIIGIVFIIAFLRFAPTKYTKYIPNKRSFAVVSIIIISIVVIVIFVNSNFARISRTINLSYDLQHLNLMESVGTVYDRFSYEKGGSAVVVDGEEYYILPEIGLMNVGEEYCFSYLPSSKFIVSFWTTVTTSPM